MSKLSISLLTCICILLVICSLQAIKLSKLNATVNDLTTEKELIAQTLQNEQKQFKTTIANLEQELSKYTLDAEAYQCAVSCKAKAIDNKAKEEESRIRKELQSDSSSDNQLDIARRMLDEFNCNKKD